VFGFVVVWVFYGVGVCWLVGVWDKGLIMDGGFVGVVWFVGWGW
jgi:hypothetical protein